MGTPREVPSPERWLAELRMLVEELRITVGRDQPPKVREQLRERYRPGLKVVDRLLADLERFVDGGDAAG